MKTKDQIKAVQPLLEQIATHGPWCGRCGAAMTPQNSTVAPELFLCDRCAPESGIKPVCSTCNGRKWVYALSTEDVQVDCPQCVKTATAAQPKTALAELAEYCEHEAATHLHMSRDKVWAKEHQELYEQYKRWGIACREANGD